jgi:hypothetical protein
MTTTKEFKTLHGLSDSAFTRLVNKIKSEYPDQELTRRVNSRDWKIIDVALFEQYLSYQKRDSSVTPQPEVSAIVPLEALEIVPNPLDSYSPLAGYQNQEWSYTDTSELVQVGKDALSHLTQSATNNQNSGIAALIEQSRNEGAKLGVLLAQVKLGTAIKTQDEVISDYLKKQGLDG